jgi:mRNA-degrading endonuclease RelE of RelBE toxin-antitoxin system
VEVAMKNVVMKPSVEVALRTLDDANRRRVHSWFRHLANWDGDEFVRSRSHELESIPGAYVLQTNTDLRIFFTIQENTISILDIGTRQSILASGNGQEAE